MVWALSTFGFGEYCQTFYRTKEELIQDLETSEDDFHNSEKENFNQFVENVKNDENSNGFHFRAESGIDFCNVERFDFLDMNNEFEQQFHG